jgi:hypothetical protein
MAGIQESKYFRYDLDKIMTQGRIENKIGPRVNFTRITRMRVSFISITPKVVGPEAPMSSDYHEIG